MPWDSLGYDSSFAINAAAAERERQKKEQAETLQRELRDDWPAAIRAAERGDVLAMRRVAEIFAARHHVTLVTQPAMPYGASAYFNWATRTAVVRPIVDEESFATVLHEVGHGACGPCPQTEPHRRDPTVADWWDCLQCETDATGAAMKAVPFTRRMFARLARNQWAYRRRTPAPTAALADCDRVAGTVFYAECKQAHARQRWRHEWLASVKGDLARDQIRRRHEEDKESRAFHARLTARMRQESR